MGEEIAQETTGQHRRTTKGSTMIVLGYIVLGVVFAICLLATGLGEYYSHNH